MSEQYQLSELQEKWLKALESGEYKQTHHRLHDGEGYCCLGLACVVAGMTPTKICADEEDASYEFGGEWEGAPASVVGDFRLRGSLGDAADESIVISDWVSGTLAEANDAGATFAEIAAAIRANPENFFLPNEVAP
jgi:hypothetical protein